MSVGRVYERDGSRGAKLLAQEKIGHGTQRLRSQRIVQRLVKQPRQHIGGHAVLCRLRHIINFESAAKDRPLSEGAPGEPETRAELTIVVVSEGSRKSGLMA